MVTVTVVGIIKFMGESMITIRTLLPKKRKRRKKPIVTVYAGASNSEAAMRWNATIANALYIADASIPKKRQRPEAIIQETFFEWLCLYPKFRALTFAIPNGGSRNAIEAKGLKRGGVLSGVPDIFMAIPSKGHHGLFIEVKSKKGIPSDNQSAMMERLTGQGYLCLILNDSVKMEEAVKDYLGVKNLNDRLQSIPEICNSTGSKVDRPVFC